MPSAEAIETARALPPAFILGMAAIMGSFVGSFTNVVVYRLPRNCLSINNPRRSFCPSCKTQLAAKDNIPILGWVALLGKCRYCKKPISARYPLVESLVATLFAIVVWRGMVQGGPPVTADWHAWLTTLTMLVAVGIMVPLALIDFDLTIIPDELSIYPLVFFLPVAALTPAGPASGVLAAGSFGHLRQGLDLSLADPLLFSRLPLWLNGVCSVLVAGAAGAGALWLIGKMGNVLFREKAKAMGGETMGFGDVKLLFRMGGMLGWPKLLMAFGIAVVLGAVIGLVLRFTARNLYVPFGPFLVVGTLAALLLPSELMGVVSWYIALITPGGRAGVP